MDQEDRDILIRIDERTAKLAAVFETHVVQNREDFKDVHHRVNRVVAKQNWMLGVGTAVGSIVGVIVIWLTKLFAGDPS